MKVNYMISNKRHNQIVEDLKKHYEKELQQARDLTSIIKNQVTLGDKILTLTNSSFLRLDSTGSSYELNFPDNVLVYVADLLGGKVIKQEGTKCIVIEQDGSVKTGLTKSAADKGFNYKLIRK